MSQARIATEHELRCWPKYFRPVVSGVKSFEVRYDDRGFQEGDTLLLREWNPHKQDYTGEQCRRRITYILREDGGLFGLEKGYVVLGLVEP